MPKVEFKRVQTDEEVENIDIKDGQLIYTGTGKTYMDYGNERIPTGSGGSSVEVDTEMSDTSENAVQNKVIKEYVDDQVSSIPEEVIISNSEPTSTGNKIWIDTGEIGSAVSEITNEYSTSTGLGYSCNFINNLLYIGYVDIEISKTADSEANLTMTVPTGYRFLTWYSCITLGWVGSVYIENMLTQTTKIHNNITKGTGNGWTRNYYLCVKGS